MPNITQEQLDSLHRGLQASQALSNRYKQAADQAKAQLTEVKQAADAKPEAPTLTEDLVSPVIKAASDHHLFRHENGSEADEQAALEGLKITMLNDGVNAFPELLKKAYDVIGEQRLKLAESETKLGGPARDTRSQVKVANLRTGAEAHANGYSYRMNKADLAMAEKLGMLG